MSKTILVAGAGHGGLVAAARLAKAGFSVTVFEKSNKDDIGYNWTDSASYGIMEKEGLPVTQADFTKNKRTSYFLASGSAPIIQNEKEAQRNVYSIERKRLIHALIENAENSGVNFSFSTEVIAPVVSGARVTGLITSAGEFESDLIIDAAGVASPVRSALPEETGIESCFANGEVLHTYRAIFERNPHHCIFRSPYEIFIYFRGEKGLSWCITEEKSVDILIGSFLPVDRAYIDNRLSVFRNLRPQISEKILRGGETVNLIPTRRPLAQFVCDGYAAVGDSAYMTEPMTGSGINLSIKAGAMLAEAVIADTEGEFSVSTLWKYNYDYIKKEGGSAAAMDILKNVLLNMKPEKLDALMENEVLTKKDLSNAGGQTTVADLVSKLLRGAAHIPSLARLALTIKKGDKAKKLYAAVPEVYNCEDVDEWKKKLSAVHIPLDIQHVD